MTDRELKDLLGRAVEPLDEMPDAVPATLVEGRRSVRRRRTSVAVVGAAATVAAVVGGSTLFASRTGPDGVGFAGAPSASAVPSAGPTAVPTTAATPSTAPTATPSAVRPTATGVPSSVPSGDKPDVMADGKPVPEALKRFHVRAAAGLDAALPARFGKVRPRPQVHGYDVTVGGSTYAITFRVDASAYADPVSCAGDAAESDKAKGCVQRTLPNGRTATAQLDRTGVESDRVVDLPSMSTTVDGHEVALYLFNDTTDGSLPPITPKELLDVAAHPRFTALVTEWSSHPDWTGWTAEATATPNPAGTPTR